jgi:hypothetical protein
MSYYICMTNTEDKEHTEKENATKALALQLQQSLAPLDNDDNPIATLRNQMQILNQICNRMLADADDRYDKLIQYNLALRAQNQYRQTLLAMEALEAQGRKDV